MRWLAVAIGYATIKWLTNGSQLHHLRLEIQGLEVGGCKSLVFRMKYIEWVCS